MRLRLPWAKPPPPPPPPPPPSLHAALGVSGADILLAGAACGALALVLLLLVWLSLRRQPAAGDDAKPLVSVEARDAAKGRVAVVNAPPESTLAPHVRRLLKLRGFAEVRLVDAAAATTDGRRSQGRKALVAACKGADLAVDVAYEAEGTSASSVTEMFLRACAGANVRAIVQCSDALVGYDPAEDACDGDESADAGVSLNSPEPKAPVEASGRLLALRRSEDALARHRASSASVATFVLRLHRVYDSSARVLPALVPLLLASWGGVLCGGARAQTNVLHVEDAALAVVLAADRSAASGTDGEAVVVTDPAVWSAAHLLRCAAAVLRVPRPLLPLLAPLRLVASAAALLGLGAPAACVRTVSVHSYFSGERAKASLGFEPAAGSGGLYAALCGLRARCGVALRLVPPLLAAAAALVVDAHSLLLPGVSTAHATPLSAPLSVLAALSLLYALLPPPSKLPAPPALTPPVVSGALPLLGHLLQFMKGPVSMIDDLRVRYRSTFTIYVGPQRITFMIGAGPQLAFIKAKDELLDQAPVYAFTIPVFGKGIVYDSPLDERLQQVKLLVHTMNTKSLEGMIPKMITEAEDYFGAWGDEGTVELRHVFSELIIMTASACLMGREIREGLSGEIARIYHALDGGLTPLSTLWPSAPTQSHRERDAARKEMVGIFSKIIAARRSGEVREADFLQQIIDFKYKDELDKKTGKVLRKGRSFTDSEVTGWLIVLLFAGQHTSSITSTWLGAMILSHPEALQDLKAEQERLAPDAASLTYASLLEMDCMRRSITEALRLYPPLILLMRKVMKKDFKVGAHTIPKGDVVGLCAPASNLDPRYWHDATAFKPSRFLKGTSPEADTFDSRSVGHGLLQGFMLSFGGGAHMCSGRRFGFLQVSVIWTILLRDFDLELISPVPKPAYQDMVVGPDGPINVKFKRKASAKKA